MKSAKEVGIDLVWGFGLWVFGYVLGMMLFTFVPLEYLGLVITPFALALAIWVCIRRFFKKNDSVLYLLAIGAAWFLIAFAFDYIFLVQAYNVKDYYDYDVLFYYLATLLMPLIAGRWNVITTRAVSS
ncbi:hypothetical protein HYW59_03765 [Candidatus Kaiserbacteria bacterium]|nr:hypothetical protein [Candidatus Kaiserbacteria bacterium]